MQRWHRSAVAAALLIGVSVSFDARSGPMDQQRLDGFNVIASPDHPFGSASARLALANAKRLGAKAIAVVPFFWQANPTNPGLIRGEDMSDDELRAAIRDAHALGLAVVAKPHVWVPESWAGAVIMNSDTDWRQWFANYQRELNRIARIADDEHADAFAVGTELAKTSQRPEWEEINHAGTAVITAATSSLSIGGNTATATALANNGTNCSAGQAASGVDAWGNAEGCAAYSTFGYLFPSNDSNFGNSANATSSVVGFTGGILASSTSQFANATSSLFTAGQIWNTGITSALVSVNSNHQETAYGGASACSSNNFVTTISGSGATTCGTASISGVNLGSNLNSLSNDGATLSGSSYNGSATVSNWAINLAHSNWWTALENFTNASTSELTATSSVWLTGLTAGTGTFCALCCEAISETYLRELGTRLVYCCSKHYFDHCKVAMALLEDRRAS
jgi:hypothetical protein